MAQFDLRLEHMSCEMKDQREQIAAVRALSVSIEHLTREVGRILPLLENHGTRITQIEMRPGKELAGWARYTIFFLTGVVLSYLMTRIGG
jgi:hypothetical protein